MAQWWQTFFDATYAELQVAGRDDAPTRADADTIERRLGLDGGERVLDVPCGAGRHALELARRGYAVTGVDFNAAAIEAGRSIAAEEGLDADLRVGDMRAVELPGGFDGAFCWFGSFGYFDDADNRAFLAHVASLLRPGARFAIDTVATETIYPRFRERDWRWIGEGDDRARVLEQREYDPATAVLRATWTLQKGGTERASVSEMRLYAYREIAERLVEAGFEDVRGFDGLTDAPFGVGASRLTVVATRR